MRMRRHGGFFISLLINLLLNAEGMIPAAVLLVLHFTLGWSVFWSVGALCIWISVLVIRMLIIRWANRCGNTPDPPKENKNPYSAKNFPWMDK